MIHRGTLVLAASTLLVAATSAHAAGRPQKDLYEWHPNGERNGPQLVIEDKLYVSGKFGVQCGKSWIFSSFGGGGEQDPFTLSAATGVLSGSASFAAGTVGIGSSYRNAEINYYDFKSAGPVTMTLNAQTSQTAAVGTLGLKLYTVSKARRHARHKVRPKRLLSASCSISFDAPNFYAQGLPAAEAPGFESSSTEG